jgi:hypothetical protein
VQFVSNVQRVAAASVVSRVWEASSKGRAPVCCNQSYITHVCILLIYVLVPFPGSGAALRKKELPTIWVGVSSIITNHTPSSCFRHSFPCYVPLSCSCHVPLLCSPVMFPCYVPLLCSPVTFPCYVPLLCSPVVFPCYIPLLCFPVMFPCHVPLLRSPVMFPYYVASAPGHPILLSLHVILPSCCFGHSFLNLQSKP